MTEPRDRIMEKEGRRLDVRLHDVSSMTLPGQIAVMQGKRTGVVRVLGEASKPPLFVPTLFGVFFLRWQFSARRHPKYLLSQLRSVRKR